MYGVFFIYIYANRITWVFLFSIFFVAWNRRSCLHPRAATTMAAALRASFAALSHSLLFPLCAPDWESFRESCVWLLAVEAAIKAVLFFSSFFLLWSPSPGWQWKICVCWVRFSARSGMRWLMWRMLVHDNSCAAGSGETCRGSVAGSERGAQSFLYSHCPSENGNHSFTGLHYISSCPYLPDGCLPPSRDKIKCRAVISGLTLTTDLTEAFCWASRIYS